MKCIAKRYIKIGVLTTALMAAGVGCSTGTNTPSIDNTYQEPEPEKKPINPGD